MTRITFALATVLSLAFTPLAAQETNCDGWSQSGWEVAQPFWEAATVDTEVVLDFRPDFSLVKVDLGFI
jgi:hypothetical protein